MEKITEIIDGNFRTGTGAKGAWVLMKVGTDSGKVATIFAPAAIGDTVELEYNEKYKSYSAKKSAAGSTANAKLDKLDDISIKLDYIIEILSKEDEGEPF